MSSDWDLNWRRIFLWGKTLDWYSDSDFKPWICSRLIFWFWLWSCNALKLVFNLKPWSSPMEVKHRLKSLSNERFCLPELISLAVKWGYLHSAIVYFYRKPSGAKTVSSDLCHTETDWCQLEPVKIITLQSNDSQWINFFSSSGSNTPPWKYHLHGGFMGRGKEGIYQLLFAGILMVQVLLSVWLLSHHFYLRAGRVVKLLLQQPAVTAAARGSCRDNVPTLELWSAA